MPILTGYHLQAGTSVSPNSSEVGQLHCLTQFQNGAVCGGASDFQGQEPIASTEGTI